MRRILILGGTTEARRLAERATAEARSKQEAAGEAERVRGRRAAEQNDFAGALEHFQRALQLCPTDWPARTQIQADIDAISAWQQRGQVSLREQQK